MFKAKVYKLGRAGRLAIMIPKEAVLEAGEYEVEVKKLDVPETTPLLVPEPSENPINPINPQI